MSFVKNYYGLAAVLLGVFWLTDNYRISINMMPSLPQKYWLVVKGKMPRRGDYVCFNPSEKAAKELHLSPSVTFTKQVVGIAGDAITLKNRDFYINNQYMATAKTHSLKGEPLNPGPTGVLGKGQYYVFTPHKDSFDSRYEKMGWVNQKQIIGVAYPLW